jgi:hypothetical protein
LHGKHRQQLHPHRLGDQFGIRSSERE